MHLVPFVLLCRLANHEKSKKHKEKVVLLKQFMQEEELQASAGASKQDVDCDSNDSSSDALSSSPSEPKAQAFTSKQSQDESVGTATDHAGYLDASMRSVDLDTTAELEIPSSSRKAYDSSSDGSTEEGLSFAILRY